MDYILWGRPIYETAIFILVYSFLGWTGEVIYAYYKRGQFINRGFLYGPFCPIYGISITTALTLLRAISENIMLLFVISVAVTTTIEYITSIILEKAFGSKWWDYSKNKFNLNGRVCLFFSILWGLAILTIYLAVHPQIIRIIDAVPKRLSTTIAYISIIIFIVDITMTMVSLVNLRMYYTKLQDIAQRARNFTGSRFEKTTKIKEFLDIYRESDFKLKFNQKRLLKSFPDFKKNRFGKLVMELKNEIEKFKEDPLNRR